MSAAMLRRSRFTIRIPPFSKTEGSNTTSYACLLLIKENLPKGNNPQGGCGGGARVNLFALLKSADRNVEAPESLAGSWR
jgi:hypothetical protein